METLDDVVGGQDGTLDDVIQGSSGRTRMTVAPSNINLATQVAAVSPPDQVENVYRTVNAELNEDIGGSATADYLVGLAREQNFGKARSALIDYLADPTIPDEDKGVASNAVLDYHNDTYSLSSSIAFSSLEADSVDSNNEVEFTRTALADAMGEVNAWRSKAQRAVNREAGYSDASTAAAFHDIFEYFVPFVEQKGIGETLSQLKGGGAGGYAKAIGLLGESKTEIRDMVLSIAPAERMQFTENLIELVNQSSNIVLGNENDFAKVDMLRTFLEGGYYTDADRWIDNAIGVLDLVGVGGFVGGFADALKGSRRAGGTLEGDYIPRADGTSSSREVVAGAPSAGGRTEGVILTGDFEVPRIDDGVLRLQGPSAETASSTRSRVQPSSISQIYRDTNTGKARAAHEASMSDESGEAAQAFYGSSRADVVAHDVMPEISVPSGAVKAKINHPDYIYQMANATQRDIFDYAKNTGGSGYFEIEKQAMRSLVVHDFEQVLGITPRKEMFQITSRPDGVGIRAMYGPSGSGFSDPIQALDTVKVAMRKYGIDETNLTLYSRNGSEYMPVALRQAGEAVEVMTEDGVEVLRNSGDFLVGLDFNYKFNPFDVTKWAETDVKYNLFDRMGLGIGSSGRGSLTRHILDPGSMFDPVIVKSLYSAVDKAAEFEVKMIKMAREYADVVGKLPSDRANLIEEYLIEANHKGIGYDYSRLITAGFTPVEVNAMKAFTDYWDTVYWARNRDFATTLRGQGYFEFIDSLSDTRLIVKPVSSKNLPKKVKVYDQTTDSVVEYNKLQLVELYEGGGVLAKTKAPMQFGDEQLEYLVAPNVEGKPYMRAITENTEVMNYRDGYFPVTYKDKIFIDRVYVGKDGTEQIRAVATAGSTKDAQLMVARLSRVDGSDTVSFRHRPDNRDKTKAEAFQDDWDLSTARGMSAQKVRGKTLEMSTSNVDDMATAPILNPVDTMVSSIRSVSNRVPIREVLDPYKARTIAQYGEYLPLDKFNQPYIPSSTKDIKYRGNGQSNMTDLGAARSNVEYIQYIENGYINDIDDIYKRTLKSISHTLGEAGNSKLEKTFSWMSETRGPAAMAKNLTFQLYIGLNPARQIIVQSHQSIQLFARFPKWTASLRGPSEMIVLTAFEMGQKPSKVILSGLQMSMKDAEDMYKQWRHSGFSASVDKQNLIRGALLDLADRTSGKGMPGITDAAAAIRKVGFDAGETVNLMTAWLAHRDNALRQGLDINDLGVIEDFSAQARGFTYAMNAAGDMPYNQNALNLMLQYFQVPHKAALTMTTNRMLTPKQKLNLVGFNLIMNPLPKALTLGVFGSMIPADDSNTTLGVSHRDLVLNGLEGAMLNKVLSMATGEETYISWSGLAPLDMYGMYDTLHGFATMSPGEVWANTPTGQIFAGQNPRFTNLLKTAARFTNFFEDDYQGPSGGTDLIDVVKATSSLSSGMSNMWKARQALALGKKLNSRGDTIDPEVTEAEAVFMLAGMDTRDSVLRYWVNDVTYNASKSMYDDVGQIFNDMKVFYAGKGVTRDSAEYYSKMMSTMWISIGNENYKAKEVFSQLLQDDMRESGQASFYNKILNLHDVMSQDEVRTLINATPDMPEEMRANALRAIDDLENVKDL